MQKKKDISTSTITSYRPIWMIYSLYLKITSHHLILVGLFRSKSTLIMVLLFHNCQLSITATTDRYVKSRIHKQMSYRYQGSHVCDPCFETGTSIGSIDCLPVTLWQSFTGNLEVKNWRGTSLTWTLAVKAATSKVVNQQSFHVRFWLLKEI